MFVARNKAGAISRAVLFTAFFGFIALPLHHLTDAPLVGGSIFSVAKTNGVNVLSQQKDRIALVWVAKWHDYRLSVNPFFLRTDYKQNLLVWPVVFGDLTRSPPSGAFLSVIS